MASKNSSSMMLSLETARTLAVVKQGLHQRPVVADRQALLESIRQIGLLQLDTVSVVARSHYLVMLSRVGLYDPADLDALLYPDRSLFQQWAHAVCLIPIEDYVYFAPRIQTRRNNDHGRWKRLGDNPQKVLDEVLSEIKKRGPLASKDFKDSGDGRRSWWNWKPAKIALDILFWRGDLMIERRVNFQMYYDLAERVLPASAEPPSKTLDDWRCWAALRSVSCLGVATAQHASDYYRQKIPTTRTLLNTLETEGAVVPVEIEGWKEQAYLTSADIHLIEELESGLHQPTLTSFLSPFDNLTWNRDRLAALFGFDYRIEMYTPRAQRKYGYYVLPILHKGRFVGRLDPKADRKTKTLIIRAIYLEPDEKITEDLLNGIVEALREFMVFHGSQNLIIEHSEPKALKTAILDKWH
jgi:uncharacterized protein YcaQ